MSDGIFSWIGDWSGKRATLTPDREAFYDRIEKVRYSFLDVDRRANQLARVLRNMGVKKGDRVAAYSKNRFDMLDLFFASGKLGSILVPFNIRLTTREIEYLLNKTDPSVIVYDPDLSSAFRQLKEFTGEREVLVMGDKEKDGDKATRGLMSDASSEPLERESLSLDDPYLIVFTGGTTGLPKGAVLSHRLVFWNSVNTIVSWGLRPDDVQPLLFPLFHTGGWNVLLVPFYHIGAKTILMGDFNPEVTLKTIEQERCSLVIGVPTMFTMISQSEEFNNTNFESVRCFISGGAPCPVAIMEDYWNIGKDFKMGYGLTEVGPNNFYLPESEIRRKPTSVGFPVFHCGMKIVDDENKELCDNQVGELLLKGPHIFSGYWNEPEETKKTIEIDGWVHTGDLAMRDNEGFYFIVGRKKDMFISGGENIYPTEIEELLYKHPAVLEAAVIGIPDAKWGEVGKAFVTLRHGAKVTGDELKSYLQERLAKYKIPKEYEVVDDLPKSGTGKILKRELS